MLPQRADWAAAHRHPHRDLLAGVTVGVVAQPLALALAFGVTRGLGAQAGLITAVVAAVFGGSNLQVSEPTGAMTVVLVPVVQQFGVPRSSWSVRWPG